MLQAKKIALITLALIASVAFAADKMTVKELVADAKKFDGKPVTVSGLVDKFKQKTSKKGNDYFTFKLVDKGDKKKIVNLYGQGKPKVEVKDGQLLSVTGTYRLEKTVGNSTFKNEIQVKPDTVRILAQPKK